MTDYTPNFNLEKYTTGDAANLNDQYNASMDIIDTNLYKVNTNASNALNTANQAKTQIQTTNDNLAALGVTDINTATNIKNGTKYILETYKTEADLDYTNAWNKVMAEMENGGTIIFPSNIEITGTFVINKRNIRITNAILASPIIVDVIASNDNQDGVIIENCRFTGNNGIELKRGVGTIITKNTFTNNKYAIYATITPDIQQQIRQTIITNNSIYTKDTGIYVKPETPNNKYLGADWIIANNQINTLIENIHIEYTDGANIINNVCFLSLGTNTKTNNIYMNKCSYSIIANNELFEAGSSGIYTLDVNRIKIDNNQIVWPSQYNQVAGIHAETSTIDPNRYYTITNNTIEAGSHDGIYTNTQLCTIANNQIQYPGSKDHWKGEGEITTPCYGINAIGKNGYYNIKGNYTIGESKNNTPHLQGISDNIIYSTQLDYSASNISTYYRYFPHFVARGVSTKEEIINNKYSQGQITSFIVQTNAITVTTAEFLSNININWGPLLAIVSCYNSGSLTIDSIRIPANSSKMLLLYASQIREL